MSQPALPLRRVAYVLLAVGVLCLAYVAFTVIDAKAYQAAERQRFADTRQLNAAGRDIFLPPAWVEGRAIGEIALARLALASIVVEGDSPEILRRAVGHLSGTARPGEVGNVVIAGHRDTFFRPLQDVRIGDVLTLKTADGDYEYQVEWTAVVRPSDVSVIRPAGGRSLTLVTCFPFSFVGPAPQRFIVRAREIGAPRTMLGQ